MPGTWMSWPASTTSSSRRSAGTSAPIRSPASSTWCTPGAGSRGSTPACRPSSYPRHGAAPPPPSCSLGCTLSGRTRPSPTGSSCWPGPDQQGQCRPACRAVTRRLPCVLAAAGPVSVTPLPSDTSAAIFSSLTISINLDHTAFLAQEMSAVAASMDLENQLGAAKGHEQGPAIHLETGPRASRREVRMSPVPTFPSAADAMATVLAGLRFLAAADATQMPVQTQAECLQMLEQADAISTAARISTLSAFAAGQGYSADADYSPRAWLINRTRITKGAAVAHTAWVRRAAAHPQIARALADGEISESFARTVCQWTDKLPEDCRDAADTILVGAAKSGMDLRGLAELAGEMDARSRPDTPDSDPDGEFDDRSVRLETTFGGAGVLNGDLTPECAAVVTTVLDALSAPAGADDTRTYAQRYHDALHEAMRRLGKCIVICATSVLSRLVDREALSALRGRFVHVTLVRTRGDGSQARATYCYGR